MIIILQWQNVVKYYFYFLEYYFNKKAAPHVILHNAV